MCIALVGKAREPNTSEKTPIIMDSQLSFYAKSLDISARDQYERKLKYADSTDKLPDPYFMLDGWQNDPSMWPDLTYGDI